MEPKASLATVHPAPSVNGVDKGVVWRQFAASALSDPRGKFLESLKFDMGAAWNDALALTRLHRPLVATLAGVFLFLPQLAVALLGPGDPAFAPGAPPEAILSAFTDWFYAMLPYMLILLVIGTIGQLAILRLWLAPPGLSVGEAMAASLPLMPGAIIAGILSGIAIYLGMLLLIVPGLYLIGRLNLSLIAIADREVRNPITALQASWAVTQGNGWRIVGYLILIGLALGVIFLLAGMIVGALLGAILGDTSLVVLAVLESAATAIIGVLVLGVYAAIYRQLTGAGRAGIFS
jgi:hypothetical protein